MQPSSKDQDNMLRWDGKRRGWYEVYFLKWNDPRSNTAGWIRYTMTSPTNKSKQPYCELWGIFFDVDNPADNFAVKQRFPVDRLTWEKDRFSLRIDQAQLGMNACHGSIKSKDEKHSLAWDLKFDSAGPTFYHFPHARMYTMKFPKTKVLSPHQNARFSGTFTVDGRKITLEDVPGQQEHLWGTKHGLRWAWGHCNAFKEDPQAVWEGLDAQIKLGPIKSPHLKVFYVRAFGREYLFNSIPKWLLNKSSWELCHWDFEAHNDQIRIVGQVSCRPEEMVGVTYTDPDSELLWCNNTKVASIKLKLYGPGGTPMGELTSKNAAAAEYVDRKTYPQVPIQI
ncbi:MAG: hypothetical protein JRJ87_24325 [Deltaproteobacteria bacterium]|nr:hypothetical protein [Deltaproteobacteria bacterium]